MGEMGNGIIRRNLNYPDSLECLACNWQDNYRLLVKDMAYVVVEWNHLYQEREQWLAVVNT
jgi:hypothetical protein